jgi:ubiquinone/menaquinone biosynthesis C-methylase UbiE
MCNRYATATFEDLTRLRFERIDIPERRRVSSLLKRGRRMMDMFKNRLLENYILPGKNLALDIGCGVGLSSIALSQEYRWVVGLDPYLPDLIRARKFFDEQKIENVILIQAYAQNIPLHSKCVDYAVALNVIEHLLDVESAFHELRRVLQRNGCFCGDSRNRFDLFLPEPHVKLRWFGLFPRKLQPWYARKLRNVAYSDLYLLSLFDLRRYGRQAFGNSIRVVFPIISAYGKSPKWDKWIKIVESIPIFNTAILVIFPSHILLAKSE